MNRCFDEAWNRNNSSRFRNCPTKYKLKAPCKKSLLNFIGVKVSVRNILYDFVII